MPPPTPAVGLNATLEFVKASGDARTIGTSEPAATSVDFGLWDHAYDPTGTVITSADVAQDFISGDSRRFYFRVRHAEAAGSKFVTMEWWALYADNKRLDSPSVPTLTLTEIEPGVFVSSAVMLVSERSDVYQATHSQLTDPQVKPQFDPRYHEASDHRLRLGSMFGKVEARYPAGGDVKVRATVGIFTGRRRQCSVQVFVIRNAFADDAEYSAALTKISTSLLRKVTGCFERIGIWFYAATAPGNAAANLGTDIKYDIVTIAVPTTGADAIADPTCLTKDDEDKIGKSHPAIGTQARIFFCKKLATHAGGETWSNNAYPVTRRFASFVTVGNPDYSTAHELGHSLTMTAIQAPEASDQQHFLQPATPPGNRMIQGKNLMSDKHPSMLVPRVNGENTRLWDCVDLHGYNQYEQMRACVLTGPLP